MPNVVIGVDPHKWSATIEVSTSKNVSSARVGSALITTAMSHECRH
ncbi:GH25 family lysozyme M1 (1,4-beta-N-acetylmuramidase) [Actinoplanes couchii]|nr:GH25 family lysozyme M1 (1,4-beta-N-acetylmuramidase) [Actinoplanes couchii]